MAALCGLCLSVTQLAGCSGFSWPWRKMDKDVVAMVNGLPVRIQDVDTRFQRLEKDFGGQAPKTAEETTPIKRAILKELINRNLLISEAVARGFVVAPLDLDRERKKFAEDLSQEELKEAMADARTSPESLEETLREDLLIARLMDDLASRLSVNDQEAADYYARNKGAYTQTEAVKVLQIVVNNEEEAVQARRAVLAGQDFAQVARKISISPDAQNGGDLGFIEKGQMPTILEESAFALQPGQVSGVIESPYGFHVLKIVERQPAKQLELAEVKDRILVTLKAAKREVETQKLLTELAAKATVKYNRRFGALVSKMDD